MNSLVSMDEDLSIALKDGLDENSKNPYGRAAVIDGYRDSCRIVVSHVLVLIVERNVGAGKPPRGRK